ncbi:MAG: hypothetical protein NXH83_03015 [Rhodobacteraceae bacterium]|nr:hypothetical protein [Paracoccaceae bacterium]
MTAATDAVRGLADRIAALPDRAPRRLVAVAGPPGAGKSTLAAALVEALGPAAALVPMDGFHLDNTLLRAGGLIARKGAPETFDAEGFVAAMQRLETRDEVILPVFDRARDIAVAGAVRVGPEHRIAVVEGNYLLLDAAPWRGLAGLWSLAVFLDPGEAELERRLIERWRDHGLDPAAAAERARGNDLRNARLVLGAVAQGPAPLIRLADD